MPSNTADGIPIKCHIVPLIVPSGASGQAKKRSMHLGKKFCGSSKIYGVCGIQLSKSKYEPYATTKRRTEAVMRALRLTEWRSGSLEKGVISLP